MLVPHRTRLCEVCISHIVQHHGLAIGPDEPLLAVIDAVVILMSDHGPEFGLDWYDGAASDLRTRFGAFFAARSSSVEYPRDVIVSEALLTALRELGHARLPRLEDRYFVTGAYDKLATLREIPDPWTGD